MNWSPFHWSIFFIVGILSGLWYYDAAVYWWILVIGFYQLLLIAGVAIPKWCFFGPVLFRKEDEHIYLTFDDGPNAEWTPQFLDLLKAHEAHASFFLIGKNIKGNEDLVLRIKKEGHGIGNHSMHHHWKSTFYSSKKYLEEIKTADAVLAQLQIKTHYYRPPFGVVTPHIFKAVKNSGKIMLAWDLRPKDTRCKKALELFQNLQKGVSQGQRTILLHDQSEVTYLGLKMFLEAHPKASFKSIIS